MPDINEIRRVKRSTEAELLRRPGVRGVEIGYKYVGVSGPMSWPFESSYDTRPMPFRFPSAFQPRSTSSGPT